MLLKNRRRSMFGPVSCIDFKIPVVCPVSFIRSEQNRTQFHQNRAHPTLHPELDLESDVIGIFTLFLTPRDLD